MNGQQFWKEKRLQKSKSKHLGYGNVVQIYFESGVQDMAANATTLTEKMRAALRISSTSEKITEEINDCIAACKADMKNDGVKVIKETDGLIIRAITLYCKAEFGFNNAAEQFRKSYDALKMRLSLSAEYNTAPQVSETDTNSTESGV